MNNAAIAAIVMYIKSDKAPPKLAVLDENFDAELMGRYGFNRKDDYWIISRDKAQEEYDKYFGQRPNYAAHWQQESEQRAKLIRKAQKK